MFLARITCLNSACILACCVLWAASAPLSAQTPGAVPIGQAASTHVRTYVFKPPRIKKLFPAISPTNDERGGWVILGFMVDTQGKPYEVAVVSSVGDSVFQKIAVGAIERSTFAPAMLNGQPIESATEIQFSFVGQGSGVSRTSLQAYRTVLDAARAGDRAAADNALRQLQITNLYDDALWGLARYAYDARWGNDPLQQLHDLRRALGPYSQPYFLLSTPWKAALLQSLRLQVQLRYYGEAVQTWEILQKSPVDPNTMAKVGQLMGALEKLRTDGEAYDVSGVLSDYGWSLHLFKPHFHVKADGTIVDIKLRCDRGYLPFAFDPQTDYHVQGKYGSCSLQVEGTPGTHVTLTQF